MSWRSHMRIELTFWRAGLWCSHMRIELTFWRGRLTAATLCWAIAAHHRWMLLFMWVLQHPALALGVGEGLVICCERQRDRHVALIDAFNAHRGRTVARVEEQIALMGDKLRRRRRIVAEHLPHQPVSAGARAPQPPAPDARPGPTE